MPYVRGDSRLRHPMFEVTCGLGASPGASSTRPSGSCPRWWPTPDSTGTAGTRSPARSAPAPRRPTRGSTRRNACHARGRIPNPQITRSTLSRGTRLACNDASRQCHERTRSTGSFRDRGPRLGPRRISLPGASPSRYVSHATIYPARLPLSRTRSSACQMTARASGQYLPPRPSS